MKINISGIAKNVFFLIFKDKFRKKKENKKFIDLYHFIFIYYFLYFIFIICIFLSFLLLLIYFL
jgi:hypothetical protein